jgi:hypothetical protein
MLGIKRLAHMEAQMRPMIVAIPRFIQLGVPLLPLKPTGQSRRGVIRIMEAQVRPMVKAIPKFIQLVKPLPPLKPGKGIPVRMI